MQDSTNHESPIPLSLILRDQVPSAFQDLPLPGYLGQIAKVLFETRGDGRWIIKLILRRYSTQPFGPDVELMFVDCTEIRMPRLGSFGGWQLAAVDISARQWDRIKWKVVTLDDNLEERDSDGLSFLCHQIKIDVIDVSVAKQGCDRM